MFNIGVAHLYLEHLNVNSNTFFMTLFIFMGDYLEHLKIDLSTYCNLIILMFERSFGTPKIDCNAFYIIL